MSIIGKLSQFLCLENISVIYNVSYNSSPARQNQVYQLNLSICNLKLDPDQMEGYLSQLVEQVVQSEVLYNLSSIYRSM